MTRIALMRLVSPVIRSALDLASSWTFRMSMADWLLLAGSFAGSIAAIWRNKADESRSQPD
jgi:hypothetical protein